MTYDKDKKDFFNDVDEFYFKDNLINLARSVKIAKKILKENNCEELLTKATPKPYQRAKTPL